MRRWHEERELMLTRWRQEVAKHKRGYIFPTIAVPPAMGEDDCHCFRGMGVLRKRRPLDCGRPRCGLCHPHKRQSRQRLGQDRAAFDFEWDASGGWP